MATISRESQGAQFNAVQCGQLLNEAVRDGKIDGKTARFAQDMVHNHGNQFDIQQATRWVDTKVREHDTHHEAARVVVKNIFTSCVKQSVAPSRPPVALLSSPQGLSGFAYNPQTVNLSTKYAVRNETCRRADRMLSDPNRGPLVAKSFHFPNPPRGNDTQARQSVLGRFEAVTFERCIFTHGASYQEGVFEYGPSNRHNGVSVTHIAAINIGEHRRDGGVAPDVDDYKNTDGTLNEAKFLHDMKFIYATGFEGQVQSGASYLVWNPVGMGAFLREIHNNFHGMTPDGVDRLRDGLALAMIEAFKEARDQHFSYVGMKLHLCLSTGDDESNKNYNAFMKALYANPSTYPSVEVDVNADMVDLAQCLADRHGEGNVGIIVASNRSCFGNHWFEDGAPRAGEEGTYRRSPILAENGARLNDQKLNPNSTAPITVRDSVLDRRPAVGPGNDSPGSMCSVM